MTEKHEKVFKLVSLIPTGKVMTYGQISKVADLNSARLVGWILHTNTDPKNVPCHRVVFKDGSLSKGYAFGGEHVQREKLESEGIQFENDKVIMKKHLLEI